MRRDRKSLLMGGRKPSIYPRSGTVKVPQSLSQLVRVRVRQAGSSGLNAGPCCLRLPVLPPKAPMPIQFTHAVYLPSQAPHQNNSLYVCVCVCAVPSSRHQKAVKPIAKRRHALRPVALQPVALQVCVGGPISLTATALNDPLLTARLVWKIHISGYGVISSRLGVER